MAEEQTPDFVQPVSAEQLAEAEALLQKVKSAMMKSSCICDTLLT